MNLNLTDLCLIFFLLAVGLYFWNALGIKQHAFKIIRSHCQQHGVQLLDDSLVLRSIKPQRDRGNLHLRRVFSFEFSSTGEERYNGQITLLGKRPIAVDMDPHRIPQA